MKSYSKRSVEIPKSKIYIIGLLALVLLFGAAFQYTKNIHSLGDIKKKELLAEYELLPVLSDTIMFKMNSSSKYRQALVSVQYLSDKSDNEVRDFYLKNAPLNGWVFLNEKNLKNLYGSDIV